MDFNENQKSALIFEIFTIHKVINLPWGHVRSHTKFGLDGLFRFDVYWIQTNKQTDKQSIHIDR